MRRIRANVKETFNPLNLVCELSLSELNRYPDEYYKRIPEPELQMGKPFSMTSDVAGILHNFALLRASTQPCRPRNAR